MKIPSALNPLSPSTTHAESKKGLKIDATLGNTPKTSLTQAGPSGLDVKKDISPEAMHFAQAQRIAQQAPDIRADKVAALQKSIAAGTYVIHPEPIAERLLEDHLVWNQANPEKN